jgi:diguanylate cyclase (GGDEF)-like protein
MAQLGFGGGAMDIAMQDPEQGRKDDKLSPRDRLNHWLGARTPKVIAMIAVLNVGAVGIMDYLTGYEFSFSLFYLVPISLAAWYGGWRLGLGVAFLSTCVCLGADLATGYTYSYIPLAIWDIFVRLGFFAITARLLSLLKENLRRQYELARIDSLTGLLNVRAFRQELRRSIELALRSATALTLAYIDVDNFKTVNDTLGHDEGDKLLQAIGQVCGHVLRATDYAGRLGGDEFGVVLPATEAEGSAAVIQKLHQQLSARMAEGGWTVSFSIGVITMNKAKPAGVDEALKLADTLMYEVKRSGKNALRHREF